MPGDSRPGATRWTYICAWDGHELGAMDYVQISPHERVCQFHQAQFQQWCQETSRSRYRSEGETGSTENQDGPVAAVSQPSDSDRLIGRS